MYTHILGLFCRYFLLHLFVGNLQLLNLLQIIICRKWVVLLIARGEGVETKPIKTSYSATAGTAFVTFNNVKVPYENTVGKVGNGMQVLISLCIAYCLVTNFGSKVVLSNFNHERWMIVCISARTQRLIVEECLK